MTESTAVAENTEVTPTPTQGTDTTQQPSEDRPRSRRRDRGPRREKTAEAKEFEEAILQIDRVTRVVRGGRRMRFRVSVVIGDRKGRVGFGIGKSVEVMTGVQKAIAQAKRNLITVPIFEDSIPHPVEGRFKASKISLFPAPEGKGVIAGGAVRKFLELAGVQNVLSKIHGSRNRLNCAHATILALQALANEAPPSSKKKKEEAADEAPKQDAPVKEEKAKSEPKKEKKPAAKNSSQ